jgi:hypothetical protein
MCWIIGSQNLKRELAAWRRLSHRNIVSLLGTTTDTDGTKGMVSLWMENGSLEKYMNAKGALPSSQQLHLVGFLYLSHIIYLTNYYRLKTLQEG